MIPDSEVVAICEESRWLGDLYQAAFVGDPKGPVKLNALVQTPGFVGDFLLDRTLEPALKDFGLPGFRAIDPACGTGHLLLQMLARLFLRWQAAEPKRPPAEHVRRALESIHGVDLDPFAVCLAKLRLLRAAVRLAGLEKLPGKRLPLHLAWGDSLLEPEHALQPHALMAEVRRLRALAERHGIDWKAGRVGG